MRSTIAYLTSIVVHISVLAGLACWIPHSLNAELDVAQGETIIASFSTPSVESEPTPTVVLESVDAQPLPPEPPAPNTSELEVTPADTKLTRQVVETSEIRVETIQASPADQDETPPPQKATGRPPPPTEAPRSPEAFVQKTAKVTKTTVEIAQHSVAMPYSAPMAAGATVDKFPRKLSSNRAPFYPPEEASAGIQGLVHLRVLVGASGGVEAAAVETSSGSAGLDEAALAAVREWRFEPAKRGGVAVSFEVIVPIRFTIRH